MVIDEYSFSAYDKFELRIIMLYDSLGLAWMLTGYADESHFQDDNETKQHYSYRPFSWGVTPGMPDISVQYPAKSSWDFGPRLYHGSGTGR